MCPITKVSGLGNSAVIRRMIRRYTSEVNKMLSDANIPSVEDFLIQKEELLKNSFHKADDILNLLMSIDRLTNRLHRIDG